MKRRNASSFWRIFAGIALPLVLPLTSTSVALAAPSITIDGQFSDSCRDFTVESSAKISRATIRFVDGRSITIKRINGTTFAIEGDVGDEIASVAIKATQATATFTCESPSPAQCSDGIDNDSDGEVDYPNEPGCFDVNDDNEDDPFPLPECSNGEDDDNFGDGEYPSDVDCVSAADNDEGRKTACTDGLDNDGDTKIDFGHLISNDLGCQSIFDDDEMDPNPLPQCADGFDNDSDTFVDFPEDPECEGYADDAEVE